VHVLHEWRVHGENSKDFCYERVLILNEVFAERRQLLQVEFELLVGQSFYNPLAVVGKEEKGTAASRPLSRFEDHVSIVFRTERFVKVSKLSCKVLVKDLFEDVEPVVGYSDLLFQGEHILLARVNLELRLFGQVLVWQDVAAEVDNLLLHLAIGLHVGPRLKVLDFDLVQRQGQTVAVLCQLHIFHFCALAFA